MEGHKDTVYAVAITLDGQWAISGSWDKTCILWNLQTGQPIQTLERHTDAVWAVAITSDGQRAISGSGDATCILWDLHKQGNPFEPPVFVTFFYRIYIYLK
jgi:WD40 repeat protein